MKKLRIAYFSDLHLEHYDNPWDPLVDIIASIDFFDPIDYVVIAGDFANQKDVPKYLAYMSGFLGNAGHFIYVAGNHEFYGGHIMDQHDLKNEDVPPNVHILNRECFYDPENDIIFVGAICWPDGSFKSPYEFRTARKQYNDFGAIQAFRKLGLENGKFDAQYINKSLSEQEASKRVVISHFVPHPECLEIERIGDSLNCCYVNNHDAIVKQHHIDAWIFGHSHEKKTFDYCGTKFCSNAIGYPRGYNGPKIRIAVVEI